LIAEIKRANCSLPPSMKGVFLSAIGNSKSARNVRLISSAEQSHKCGVDREIGRVSNEFHGTPNESGKLTRMRDWSNDHFSTHEHSSRLKTPLRNPRRGEAKGEVGEGSAVLYCNGTQRGGGPRPRSKNLRALDPFDDPRRA